MAQDGSKVLVQQVRSTAGTTKRVRETMSSLGLGRIGKKKEHTLNPSIVGKLRKVRHLVRITGLSKNA